MEKNILHRRSNIIKIERFMDKNKIIKDGFIVVVFIALYIVVGLLEKNFFLPNNGFGLLEHINIWIFLFANLLIPFIIYYAFKSLKYCVDSNTLDKFKDTFKNIAERKRTTILFDFSTTVGFCCFTGNSLQNAKVINPLPFDYWDSTNYFISYIVSRVHKFYLFVYFIPCVLTYVFIAAKAISDLLTISEGEMEEYPIKKYGQLNMLCNFGLNILLTLAIPFVLLSCGVCFVHQKVDITSATTIIISITSTVICFGMYLLLIKKFYVGITIYKRTHIEQINSQLSKIHQYILNAQNDENRYEKIEIYLKKEEYLIQTKEKIEKINKFPHIIKAIFTSVSPFIPTLLQNLFQLLNAFFKSDIL